MTRTLALIPALTAAAVIGLAACGGSNANEQTCSDYWTFKAAAQNHASIADGKAALDRLPADASGASPKLKKAANVLSDAMNANDFGDASQVSYLVGAMCSGMGYTSQ